MRHAAAALICGLWMTLAPSTVGAQRHRSVGRADEATPAITHDAPTDPRLTEARAAFEAACTAFDESRYTDALAEFERCYRLSYLPALLFNIAVTLEHLERDADAQRSYERYLERQIDAANRALVEERITNLRARVAAARERRSIPTAAWVLGGAAIAFAGASTTFWLVGDSAYSDLEQQCAAGACSTHDIDTSSVGTYDTLTNVSLAASLGAAIAAGVILVLHLRDAESDERPSERGDTAALTWSPL